MKRFGTFGERILFSHEESATFFLVGKVFFIRFTVKYFLVSLLVDLFVWDNIAVEVRSKKFIE